MLCRTGKYNQQKEVKGRTSLVVGVSRLLRPFLMEQQGNQQVSFTFADLLDLQRVIMELLNTLTRWKVLPDNITAVQGRLIDYLADYFSELRMDATSVDLLEKEIDEIVLSNPRLFAVGMAFAVDSHFLLRAKAQGLMDVDDLAADLARWLIPYINSSLVLLVFVRSLIRYLREPTERDKERLRTLAEALVVNAYAYTQLQMVGEKIMSLYGMKGDDGKRDEIPFPFLNEEGDVN